MNLQTIDTRIAAQDAEDIALAAEAAQREADFLAVFCVSGRGHESVVTDDSGDQYRYVVYTTYCEDCGTTLGTSHP